MTTNKMREEFEAWALSRDLPIAWDRQRPSYTHGGTQVAWLSWQAATRRALPDGFVPVPVGDGCDSEVIAQFLYGLLDDIDTASDMAKSDDSAYRKLVERIQARKREVVAECDGYTVKFKTPALATGGSHD